MQSAYANSGTPVRQLLTSKITGNQLQRKKPVQHRQIARAVGVGFRAREVCSQRNFPCEQQSQPTAILSTVTMSFEAVQRRVPFAPLELSTSEQQHCHDLTLQLLERALQDYDERRATLPWDHSKMESSRWKRLKTQPNASLYSSRGVNRLTGLPEDSLENPSMLLAVGTIRADLDDVMFGIATPDFAALKLRAATIGRQEIDGAMLAKLSGPTKCDPFQNLSIMWMVGEQNWPLNMLVRPRDFIMLSATGVITRPNGERIGYDVVQPAPLAEQCPELPKPMTRGKIMYSTLYHENEDGTIDVFTQVFVETRGNVMDTLVVNAMWTSMLGFWDAPHYAQSKKLEWCIASRKGDQSSIAGRSCGVTAAVCSYGASCGICLGKLGRRGRGWKVLPDSNNTCALCSIALCHNCRLKRSFKVLNNWKEGFPTRDVHVVVCRPCAVFVQLQPAAEIAWQQHTQRVSEGLGERPTSRRPTWGIIADASAPAWCPGRYLTSSECSGALTEISDEQSEQGVRSRDASKSCYVLYGK